MSGNKYEGRNHLPNDKKGGGDFKTRVGSKDFDCSVFSSQLLPRPAKRESQIPKIFATFANHLEPNYEH
ncbi:MAG: hypothetical protein MJZ49_02180 [Bacteroidales bacterium]|nr:hypothetical protein [Bacteroidales bacterium]